MMVSTAFALSQAGLNGAPSHHDLNNARLNADSNSALSHNDLNGTRPDADINMNVAHSHNDLNGAFSHADISGTRSDADLNGAPSHAAARPDDGLNGAPFRADINDARPDAGLNGASSHAAISGARLEAGLNGVHSDDGRGSTRSNPARLPAGVSLDHMNIASRGVGLGTSKAGLDVPVIQNQSPSSGDAQPVLPLQPQRKRRSIDSDDNASHSKKTKTTPPEPRMVGRYRLRGAKEARYVPPTYVDPEPPLNGDPFDGAMTFGREKRNGGTRTGEDRDFAEELSFGSSRSDDLSEILEIPDSLDDPVSDPAIETIDSDTRRTPFHNDDAEFECPANGYLERECPATFTNVDEARKHCLKFHHALPLGDPACNCIQKMKDRTSESCLRLGCGWFFAENTKRVGLDKDWHPGSYNHVAQILPGKSLPSWLISISQFVYVQRARGSTPDL